MTATLTRQRRKAPAATAGPTMVRAVGSQRRIQAMAWMHWPLDAQARQAGISADDLAAVMRDDWTDPLTAKKIAAVYGPLSMKFGPDMNTHWMAIRNGWFPPLAWDDGDWVGWANNDCTVIGTWTGHDIDDPHAVPCVVPSLGKPNPVVNELHLQGWAAGHDDAKATELDMDTRDELMYRLARNGVTTRVLGEMFGLSRQTTALIAKPDKWRFYGE